MSAVPSAGNRASKGKRESAPDKALRGLMPYLRRYTGGIVFGLLTVVLMSFIGNALPLAIGVMTDTLAGNSVPFEHFAQAGTPVVLGMNASTLSRFIPYYAPSSRHTLGIYCLIVVLCVALNVAAQLGDLVESAIKRGADVKDSGSILPGHGGMLDRIDAMLFAIPVLWIYPMWHGLP